MKVSTRLSSFRLLHWFMATMILAQLLAGTVALELNDRNTMKWLLLDWHRSLGVLILLLLLIRVGMRLKQCNRIRHEQSGLAVTVHLSLYLSLLCMSITGYLQSSPYGVAFFGLQLPVIREQFYVAGISHILHANLSTVLMLLIGLHLLGAVRHYKTLNSLQHLRLFFREKEYKPIKF